MWIFDLSDGGARLLRMREGHSAPPTFIRHYGDDGSKILTAGTLCVNRYVILVCFSRAVITVVYSLIGDAGLHGLSAVPVSTISSLSASRDNCLSAHYGAWLC